MDLVFSAENLTKKAQSLAHQMLLFSLLKMLHSGRDNLGSLTRLRSAATTVSKKVLPFWAKAGPTTATNSGVQTCKFHILQHSDGGCINAELMW